MDKYIVLLKKNKFNIYDEEVIENYETRHSTEPSKAIIKINFQEKVNFLPRNKMQRNLISDLNKTYNYNTNILNTTIMPNKPAMLSETALFSERTKKKKIKSKLNNTFAVEKLRDKGFSFLNMYYSHKNEIKFNKKHTNEINTSTVLETTSRRNINETLVLKSNRSSDNLTKKKKRNQENEDIGVKVKEELNKMEYTSHKLLEIVEDEIERQKRTFEIKKEILEAEQCKSK